jgi:hypothetical protein
MAYNPNQGLQNGLVYGLGGLAGMALGLPFGMNDIMSLFQVGQEQDALGQVNADIERRFGQSQGLMGFNPTTGTFQPQRADSVTSSVPFGAGSFSATLTPVSENGVPVEPQYIPGTEGLYGRTMDSLGADRAMGERDLASLRNATLRGYDKEIGRAADAYAGLGNQFMGLERRLGAQGNQIASALGRGYGDLGGGYAQREADVLGRIQGLGATERANINEQYDSAAAANDAALRSRGLGASSLIGGARTQSERGRSRALGALGESLRAQEAGAIGQLRGEALSAQERGLQGVANAGQANLGRMANVGLTGLGAAERGIGTGIDLGLGKLSSFGSGELGRINFLLGNSANQRASDAGITGDAMNLLASYQPQIPNTNAWGNWGSVRAAEAQADAYKDAQPEWYEGLLGGVGQGVGTLVGSGTTPWWMS